MFKSQIYKAFLLYPLQLIFFNALIQANHEGTKQ